MGRDRQEMITATGRVDENGAVSWPWPRSQAGRAGRRDLADLPRGADPVRPVPRPQDRLLDASSSTNSRHSSPVRGPRRLSGQCPDSCRFSRSRCRGGRGTRCRIWSNPTKQIPVAPEVLPRLREGRRQAARDHRCGRSADPGRVVHHRSGQSPGSPGRSPTGWAMPSWASRFMMRWTTSAPSGPPRPRR